MENSLFHSYVGNNEFNIAYLNIDRYMDRRSFFSNWWIFTWL